MHAMTVEIKYGFHRHPNSDEGDYVWTAHYHNPLRPDSWDKGDYFQGGDLHSPWAALAKLIEKVTKHFEGQ